MTPTSCLQNEAVTQLIRDAIIAMRNINKQPDGQSVFEYINKTSVPNVEQKHITLITEVILNKNRIYNKPSKKVVLTSLHTLQ